MCDVYVCDTKVDQISILINGNASKTKSIETIISREKLVFHKFNEVKLAISIYSYKCSTSKFPAQKLHFLSTSFVSSLSTVSAAQKRDLSFWSFTKKFKQPNKKM